MKVLFEYTPREEQARVKVDKGPDPLGGRLIYCILVRGASLTDRWGYLIARSTYIAIDLSDHVPSPH